MSILTIVAILLIITAILHLFMLQQFGSNNITNGVAIAGIVYGILAILMLTTSFGWPPIVTLILITIGAIGAYIQIDALPEMRTWTWLFIAIDVGIVALLLAYFLG